MNERRRLQRLSRFLLDHLCDGQFAKFVINQRQKLVSGMGITLLNGGQDLSHFGHGAPARGMAAAHDASILTDADRQGTDK